MSMSTRSRGAAAAARRSRSGLRPVYEDFKPMSEWKHNDDHSVDAYILLYHLPGFVKEQIRIIAESKGLLRVRGERLLTDNKWSRFEEEVTVPEECNLSGIRAKFENDILRIVMPKLYAKNENKSHVIENEPSNSPPQPLPSNTKQSPIHQKAQPPSYTHTEPEPKTSINPQPYDTTNIESKEIGHNNKGILTSVGKNNDTIKEKQHKVIGNNVNTSNESYGTSNMKNLAKVTRKLDQDSHRQLVVNMGVAIFVIMALGASISYSLGFSDQYN